MWHISMLGQQHLTKKWISLLAAALERTISSKPPKSKDKNQLIMFDSHTDHNIFFRSNNYDYNHEINKAYIECLKHKSLLSNFISLVSFLLIKRGEFCQKSAVEWGELWQIKTKTKSWVHKDWNVVKSNLLQWFSNTLWWVCEKVR